MQPSRSSQMISFLEESDARSVATQESEVRCCALSKVKVFQFADVLDDAALSCMEVYGHLKAHWPALDDGSAG